MAPGGGDRIRGHFPDEQLRQDELGTVEPGKHANLVILDADPLQDITNTQEIHLVITDSLVLDPDVLEESLEPFGARGERPFDRNQRS